MNKQERRYALRLVALILVLTVTGLARAQQDDPRAKELEALRDMVQSLEKSLQEVRARLAELEGRRAGGTNAPATTVAPSSTATNLVVPPANYMSIATLKLDLPTPAGGLEASDPSPIPFYDTVTDEQTGAPRVDNRPVDPSLVGFIPLPGTKTMIRFGGNVRLDTIYDFADNGNPNQFVPSSIPVAGQPGADGGPRTTIEAKGTRLNFEVRRPVGDDGRLRIYYENDFFGDSASPGMDYRLRHFYGQAWNVLIGQTFTAFMDADAWPDVVDYAGPNAIINRRQPQIRYSLPVYQGKDKLNLIFSIEQPTSDISTTAAGMPPGAEPVSIAPDGVVGLRWERPQRAHVQLSGLFRGIGYDADNAPDQEVFGWGANLTGAFHVFSGDKITWQVAYGHGMARYVNDLGSTDEDAALDPSGNLTALPVFAATAGYTHQWSPHFRSTATYGYVHVDPTPSLGPLAVKETQYASFNLVWHPTTSFRMGLEYLYGFKSVQDDSERNAHRLDFVIRYDLIR
jgi:hypothetical protein